jgi:hypothetical protein
VNICATCKHWKRDDLNAEGRADCARLEELSDDKDDEWGAKFRDALIVAWPECGHDGPAVTFETRPEFGCCLWADNCQGGTT